MTDAVGDGKRSTVKFHLVPKLPLGNTPKRNSVSLVHVTTDHLKLATRSGASRNWVPQLEFGNQCMERTPLWAYYGRVDLETYIAMKILITAGPTREYLDDVRFLSNASSGRMGYAIAQAAIDAGHEVVLISGPVALPVPAGCELVPVEGTRDMYEACLARFAECDGVIASAAVCDYGPRERTSGKRVKTGQPITIELVEMPDIIAELGRQKGHRWSVGFALEAQDPHRRAVEKLHKKNCDAIVLNRTTAIGADDNSIELIDSTDTTVAKWTGSKIDIAHRLIAWIVGTLAD